MELSSRGLGCQILNLKTGDRSPVALPIQENAMQDRSVADVVFGSVVLSLGITVLFVLAIAAILGAMFDFTHT